jgi:hypothetical protein
MTSSPGILMVCDLFVLHPNLRKLLLVFVEITNLDKRWPEFQRRLDNAYHVIDNPRDVLLEKIGLKPIE